MQLYADEKGRFHCFDHAADYEEAINTVAEVEQWLADRSQVPSNAASSRSWAAGPTGPSWQPCLTTSNPRSAQCWPTLCAGQRRWRAGYTTLRSNSRRN